MASGASPKDDFENTPTAGSSASASQSHVDKEVRLPWGRLLATVRNLRSLDLLERKYTFGRMEDCDVVATTEVIPCNKFANISKYHFEITKEALDMPTMLTDLSKNGTFINEKRVGKNNKHILQNGDRISVGFVSLNVFIYTEIGQEDKFLSPNLRKKYISSNVLGTGACGEVRLVYKKDTCQRYAVKKIVKCASSTYRRQINHAVRVENEIRILKSLSHDCIVEVIEVDETDDSYYIVLEHLEGGELTDRILSMDSLPESTIKFLFYQVLLAIQYLHSEGITHRDIKAQNVLLVSQSPKSKVKITDFGLSKMLDDNSCLKTLCGTPNYVAPEIWDVACVGYDNKVDVWSLGVLLFYMFAKEFPFSSTDANKLMQLVLNGDYKFDNRVWDRVSKEAKDLIAKMLVVDPKQRISINEALNHKWFANDLTLEYEIAKLLGYVPDTSLSSTGCSSLEPPRKRLHLSANEADGKPSSVRSWP